LKDKAADAEPAPRAAAHDADSRRQKHHQQQQNDPEERIGEPPVGRRRNQGGDKERPEPDACGDELLAKEIRPVAETFLGVEIAGAEHHRDADGQKRGHGEKDPAVDGDAVSYNS
jgi:hypothetical protein